MKQLVVRVEDTHGKPVDVPCEYVVKRGRTRSFVRLLSSDGWTPKRTDWQKGWAVMVDNRKLVEVET